MRLGHKNPWKVSHIGWLLGLLHGVPLFLFWQFGLGAGFSALLVLHGFLVLSTVYPQSPVFGRARHCFPTAHKQVFLTIDDGPCADTPEVLELLAAHNTKALFFLIGERAAAHPEWVQRIVAEGHQIGNHTYTHPAYTFWAYSPSRQRRELSRCQQTLAALMGYVPVWFRAPAGLRNPFCNAIAHECGLHVLGWQARGFDGVACNVENVVRRLRKNLMPGAILLVHQGMPQSVEVLRQTLKMLKQDGWKTELPPPPNHA